MKRARIAVLCYFFLNFACGQGAGTRPDAGMPDVFAAADSARFYSPFGEYLLRMSAKGGCPDLTPAGKEVFNDLKVFQGATNAVIVGENGTKYIVSFLFGNQSFQAIDIAPDRNFYMVVFDSISALRSFEGRFFADWSGLQFELRFTYYQDDGVGFDCETVWNGFAEKIQEYPPMSFGSGPVSGKD
jgi:hypothetical protein